MSDSPDTEVFLRVPANELGQGDTSPVPDESHSRHSDSHSLLIDDKDEYDVPQGAHAPIPETPGQQMWTPQGHEMHRPNVPARYNNGNGHENQHGARRGLPVRPESYDGKGDWEEYISHFENCAELGRWSHPEKVLSLAASLRGAARTFYIGLSETDKRSYRSLVQYLGERFGSTRHQNRWLSKLEMRKRQTDESIATLGDDLRQMSQKAYCNLDTIAQEALALNQLYKVITLEMKCRCIDRDCRTVADAVDVIERYEALLDETKAKSKPVTRMVSQVEEGTNYSQSNGSQGQQAEQSMQRILEWIEQLEVSRPQANATYNRQSGYDAGRQSGYDAGRQSGPTGHSSTYANRPGYDSSQANSGYNSQRNNQRVCFVCDSPDHFFRNCPFYKKSRSFLDRDQSQPRQQQGNFTPST
jgi:hypothetical protein